MKRFLKFFWKNLKKFEKIWKIWKIKKKIWNVWIIFCNGKITKNDVSKKNFPRWREKGGGGPPHPPAGRTPAPPKRKISVPLARENDRNQKSEFFLIFRTVNFGSSLRLSQKMSVIVRFHQNYREESMQNMLKHVKKLEKSMFFYTQRWPAII